MRYRRAWQPCDTYFFTVNLAERHRTLLVDHVEHLRNTVRQVKQAHPFDILASVVRPNHLHTV
jgi:putative transposase